MIFQNIGHKHHRGPHLFLSYPLAPNVKIYCNCQTNLASTTTKIVSFFIKSIVVIPNATLQTTTMGDAKTTITIEISYLIKIIITNKRTHDHYQSFQKQFNVFG
jgi:hypothetical protein